MSASTMEVKNIFEMNHEELAEYNEKKLMEFKELFLTTNLPVDEIYEKINVSKGDLTYKYINGARKTEGLTAKDREVNFNIVESSQEDLEKELEEKYQRFKKIWVDNPNISKNKAFKQAGLRYTGQSRQDRYIHQRLKEDELPLNHNAHNSQGRPPRERRQLHSTPEEEWEDKFQEYKKYFEETNLQIKEIYKKIGVPETGTGCYQYIRRRCKEEGLNGYKRRALKRRNKQSPVKQESENKESKPKIKHNLNDKEIRTYEREATYTNKAYAMLEESEETLQRLYHERNIKKSTQKGYAASFIKYCEYTKDRFNNLQEMIDFYLAEEDQRIPMRERSIKKDLLGFREFLVNGGCGYVKSHRSFKTYFAKVKTIFNHFEVEMLPLPQMKMEKGYISNFNDLPNHAMIKTACEQSPLNLKAIILFMSSSGSAKAETLSLTVKMFLEGCSEYLEEKPTSKNIEETLKKLSDKHDIVPMIYLRRIKTDKYYYTYCSPEASYMIIEYLKTRKNLKWTDKLFDYTSSLLFSRFQEINDNNNWGNVGAYRRFRSHALRKFMASNIGLPRDQVDSIQGRSKDMVQEAYFKQDPKSMKDIYMQVMHRVMVYNNWGYGTTPEELEKRAKRLFNDFNDDEKIVDLSNIPATPQEIHTSMGLGEDNKSSTVSRSRDSKNVQHNSSNSMPVQAPVNIPVGTFQGALSISEELLNYAKLMDMGLISISEFNRIKRRLLGALVY